jgi:multiple sugar transport system permease protein
MNRKYKEYLTGYAFIAPNIIAFLAFILIPVLFSLYMSFHEWKLMVEPTWVGLANWIELLWFHMEDGRVVANDPDFWHYLGNTVYLLLEVPLTIVVALAFALLLDQPLKGKVVFRTIFILPVVSSTIAVAVVWSWLLNTEFGLINMGLRFFGIKGPSWLGTIEWAKPAVIMMMVWKQAGYNMLLCLASLQNIPNQLYESAAIDGAGPWSKFRHITLPMLSPTMFFMVIMGIIGGMQAFNAVFVLTKGGPAESTTTLVYYVYDNGFQWFKMGYASAVAWTLLIIILAFTLIQWRYRTKWVYGETEKP